MSVRPVLIAFSIVFLAAPLARAQSPSQSMDWPVYNGGSDGAHYSALTQINRGNVGHLAEAWRYDTGDTGNMETNPLIINGTLYAYSPKQKVIALDAATGQLRWQFDSGIAGTQPVRGLAWWADPAAGSHPRLLAGIMNYLYCLDATTGHPIPTFGDNGRIDLRKDLRGDYQVQSTVLTSPGIIYKDLIIVGGRDPETHPAPPGDIRAYSVRTGQLRWRFRTIPRPGEPGSSTWPPNAWQTAGAANNWAGMALDAEHGIVYAPTGSAVMDFYGGDRVGDDLFANTLLALDANTGQRLWHFQGVHHDIWDRDFPSPPALFTLQRNGQSIPALAQTTKQGYLYLFNRLTGQPLFPIHEHPFPPSTVPGEVTAPTQPVPDAPEPFARQQLTADMLTTRTPAAHDWALTTFRTFRSNGQFYPLAVGQQTVVFPGFDGGAEWGGPAIDPATSVLYVNETEMAWTGGLVPASHAGSPGEQLYRSQCAMCHGISRAGSPPAFPSLVGITARMSPKKITGNIRNGSGRMPAFPNIDAPGLAALLDFLATPVSDRDAKELAAAPDTHAPSGPVNPTYQQRCALCHGDHLQGVAPSFPAIMGVGNRLTTAQLTHLIQKGGKLMPPQPDIEGKDLAALLAWLGVHDTLAPPATAPGADAYTFTGYRKFLDPDGYPAIAPPWGTLNAIDLKTGKYLWKI
ncbi:MAG: c-type cytochrome, partial [Terracidiphilus sp.]